MEIGKYNQYSCSHSILYKCIQIVNEFIKLSDIVNM